MTTCAIDFCMHIWWDSPCLCLWPGICLDTLCYTTHPLTPTRPHAQEKHDAITVLLETIRTRVDEVRPPLDVHTGKNIEARLMHANARLQVQRLHPSHAPHAIDFIRLSWSDMNLFELLSVDLKGSRLRSWLYRARHHALWRWAIASGLVMHLLLGCACITNC
jgi:hypothetical protein